VTCPACHAPVGAGRFCSQCGSPLTQTTAPSPDATLPVTSSVLPSGNNRSSLNRAAPFGFVITLVVVAVVGALAASHSNRSTETLPPVAKVRGVAHQAAKLPTVAQQNAPADGSKVKSAAASTQNLTETCALFDRVPQWQWDDILAVVASNHQVETARRALEGMDPASSQLSRDKAALLSGMDSASPTHSEDVAETAFTRACRQSSTGSSTGPTGSEGLDASSVTPRHVDPCAVAKAGLQATGWGKWSSADPQRSTNENGTRWCQIANPNSGGQSTLAVGVQDERFGGVTGWGDAIEADAASGQMQGHPAGPWTAAVSVSYGENASVYLLIGHVGLIIDATNDSQQDDTNFASAVVGAAFSR
jgi:hypothetical protein